MSKAKAVAGISDHAGWDVAVCLADGEVIDRRGASVIECCYAASCTRLWVTMTKIMERANTDLTFFQGSKTIVDEKICPNVTKPYSSGAIARHLDRSSSHSSAAERRSDSAPSKRTRSS